MSKSSTVSTEHPAGKPPGAAMEGGGFYNRNSALQAGGIARLLPHLEAAARNLTFGDEPIVIADYGASQGRNSMAPMRIAIEEIRARAGASRAIQVVHTDLPSNDFAALFAALEDDPDSYLNGQDNIYPSAIGRSYYQPIFASNSVHLAWNTWTMHWMDGEAIHAPDHIFAAFSKDPVVGERVTQRQALDWKRFLECRAVELRPGGKLITALVGSKSGSTGWQWLGNAYWRALVELGSEGVLSRDELTRLTIPVGGRTVEDIRVPFDANNRFAGLTLEHAELVDVPDPWWQTYQKTGDAMALARNHANSTRGWSGPTLLRCLGERADRAAVVDMIFDRLATSLAASPQQHATYLTLAVLTKT